MAIVASSMVVTVIMHNYNQVALLAMHIAEFDFVVPCCIQLSLDIGSNRFEVQSIAEAADKLKDLRIAKDNYTSMVVAKPDFACIFQSN